MKMGVGRKLKTFNSKIISPSIKINHILYLQGKPK